MSSTNTHSTVSAVASRLLEVERRISVAPEGAAEHADSILWNELVRELLNLLRPPGSTRRWLRIPVESQVTVRCDDIELTARSVDVSHTGLCLTIPGCDLSKLPQIEILHVRQGENGYDVELQGRVV